MTDKHTAVYYGRTPLGWLETREDGENVFATLDHETPEALADELARDDFSHFELVSVLRPKFNVFYTGDDDGIWLECSECMKKETLAIARFKVGPFSPTIEEIDDARDYHMSIRHPGVSHA